MCFKVAIFATLKSDKFDQTVWNVNQLTNCQVVLLFVVVVDESGSGMLFGGHMIIVLNGWQSVQDVPETLEQTFGKYICLEPTVIIKSCVFFTSFSLFLTLIMKLFLRING